MCLGHIRAPHRYQPRTGPAATRTTSTLPYHALAVVPGDHHRERRPRDCDVLQRELRIAELHRHPHSLLAQRLHPGTHRHLVCIEQTVDRDHDRLHQN
jgi:hypothetical protein